MLQKQAVDISFAKGVDTKTDPWRVSVGSFLSLVNSVFDKMGRLTKRNGFANITALSNSLQTILTTLNDNLIATGSNLYAFSEDTNQWLKQGLVQPVQLAVQPLVRVSTSQSSPDSAVAPTGLTCLVYVDNSLAYYQISDSTTGQQIVSRTALPSTARNPRVFLFSQYFLITFTATVSAASHLQYIAIPYQNPTAPLAARDLATTVTSLTTGYDAYSTGAGLYYAWSRSGTVVDIAVLTLSNIALNQTPTAVALAGSHTATLMSVTVDPTGNSGAPLVWIAFYDGTDSWAASFSGNLTPILAATKIISSNVLTEITSVAAGGLLTVLVEDLNHYSGFGAYPIATVTDYVSRVTCTSAGTVVGPTIILRSVGLASKPFIAPDGTIYVLVSYGEINAQNSNTTPDQPTYFLMDSLGNVFMRLAYQNGGGYAASMVLPTVSVLNGKYYVPYLIKDFLAPVNKGTALPSGTPTNGIYTQTGVNLAEFTINAFGQYSSEIAGALHLTGGQLWEYDGVRPVEHGFQVWPDNVAIATSTGAGSIAAGTYYYVFTYEWTDNAGNLHRSAPSIPIVQVTTTSSSTNTIYVPTDRITYKVAPNPIRIVGYRYSVAQPVYYQFTSVTAPTANDTTVDYVTFTDTLADNSILGQTLLYTTGGVVEDIAAPASVASALFKNRLFLVDAEDRNLLWFSKQVIEAVPVEMSDLLTIFVAPTSGAQGSTGPITALSAMDDKLIIFKSDAIYYITGTGPDNTGANNDFSDPIYITSSVGCANPSSIVLMPNGIMFQSDKGIWLLGRDLNTTYIGAQVEQYNSNTVQSAQSIPATNQVRFILDNNVTLMYDYFYSQWGTHTNVFAISSTLYQGAHTYLNSFGGVFKETPGFYLDGSNPVLMSFVTGWLNLAGLQGYQRAFFFYLFGQYYSPHKLNVQIAYDYNPSPLNSKLITPTNYSPVYGGSGSDEETPYGQQGVYGGSSAVENWRVFMKKQRCSSFQITLNEIYDPSFGVAAGAGLTLSGINLVVAVKKGFRPISSQHSVGAS